MSLPLSYFTPPMKHTPTWDLPGEKSTSTETGLEYIRDLQAPPFKFHIKRHALVEIAAPMLGLIIAKIFFFSIPNTVLLSIAILTFISTISTSTRVLYVFSDPPEYHTESKPPDVLKIQQRLQKLLHCSLLFMLGLALVSPFPLPLLLPILMVFCIVCLILPYIGQCIGRCIGRCIGKYIIIDIDAIPTQHLTFPSLPLFCCSVASLFGSTLHSLLVRPNPWTSYLQIAACVSITLFCKDFVTELESHRLHSNIKRVTHIILCIGVLAYQAYSVFVDPISANIISALLVSTHIFFVLFRDATQEINAWHSTLRSQDLRSILWPSVWQDDALRGHVLQRLQETLQSQPSVAPWHFPARALLYILLGANLLFSPLPIQPASILLKVFFLSQIISNMTDCILKQIEASVEKQEWDDMIQKIEDSKASQEEDVQKFLQSVTDTTAKHPNPLGFSLFSKKLFH